MGNIWLNIKITKTGESVPYLLIFTVLFIENVPLYKNAWERATRNVKVKQKISGQFKVEQAAENFAKIRSVIDTTIKNRLIVLEALALIAKFNLHNID